MSKDTEAARRARRTRQMKMLIAARVAQARNEAFNDALETCAAISPKGGLTAFKRWFDQAWADALKAGAK